ncbi:hypothetical protein [Kribbella sp. VKM Ac-2568]|uniref:hypothetical protein n=1 Tax=Kribbella sp. VKM Ac-2568 TaxID=2512219 RepID=UPI0018EE7EAC|nr:hypothetical protein [Kribbella sp. VKM Ac-2568]
MHPHILPNRGVRRADWPPSALRDEGRGLRELREAGVAVTAVRFGGIIHDFVMLDALRVEHAVTAAINLAITTLAPASPDRRRRPPPGSLVGALSVVADLSVR